MHEHDSEICAKKVIKFTYINYIMKCGEMLSWLCEHINFQYTINGLPFLIPAIGWTGLFCPCVLFGRNFEQVRDDATWTGPCICHAVFVEGGLALAAATAALHGFIDPGTTCLILEGLFFSWWMCGIYTGIVRQSLQKKYHLENSPCDPCMVHCCMHWCAICQEHREMKAHLEDDSITPMAIVNPPHVQEMNASVDRQDSASPSRNDTERVNGKRNLSWTRYQPSLIKGQIITRDHELI
ncbi:cell number regulator 6-like [Primulina tabacum]|uniref:cell number regulator 6-like n=1 Tax=Primulina tabacum TaxID=48773 RepID=UPI003F599D2E